MCDHFFRRLVSRPGLGGSSHARPVMHGALECGFAVVVPQRQGHISRTARARGKARIDLLSSPPGMPNPGGGSASPSAATGRKRRYFRVAQRNVQLEHCAAYTFLVANGSANTTV